MNQKEINELVEKGWLHCKAIIEILGRPKEHVENTLKGVVGRAKENNDFKVISEEYAEAAEKEGFFSAFAELEIIFNGFPAMAGFCFDYMPSSIEIIAPENFSFKSTDMTNLLNDLQERLHKTDLVAKNLRMENDMVQANVNALLQNIVIMALRSGDRTVEELIQLTGIKQEHLPAIMQVMMKTGKLEFDGKIASLNPEFKKFVAEQSQKE